MKYCIYLRKSRADVDAELKGEMETLARHERILVELSKRQSLNVTAIYKEVVSGETIASRPMMQRLLTEVEQGLWSGVIVMEVERLARGDTIDQGIMAQTFKYSNTKIITPNKVYDPNNEFDEEYFEFGLFMSRREYKTINRRLQRGRLSSVKEGKFVGNIAPYGYARRKLEGKGFSLEPNREEAEVVKMIYELYTKGELLPDGSFKRIGAALIARKLNTLGIKPRKIDAWVISSVRDILINPVYAGKIRWNWRPANKKIENGEIKIERPRSNEDNWVIVTGLHEPIIDNDTWELAQYYMKQNPPRPTTSKCEVKNPLSGLVHCGKCGRKMVRRPYGIRNDETLICAATSCDNVSSKLYLVEENILEALEKWLEDYKINWNIDNVSESVTNSIDLKEKALKKLEDDISKVKSQINNLHDLLEQGVYTSAMFLDRSKVLTERITEYEKNKVALALEIENEYKHEETKRSVVPKIQRVIEAYKMTNSPRLKNDLLKEILYKVVYTKLKKGTKFVSSSFTLDLYPKMPK